MLKAGSLLPETWRCSNAHPLLCCPLCAARKPTVQGHCTPVHAAGGQVLTSVGSTALWEPSAALTPPQICSDAPYQVSYVLGMSHKCSLFLMCSCVLHRSMCVTTTVPQAGWMAVPSATRSTLLSHGSYQTAGLMWEPQAGGWHGWCCCLRSAAGDQHRNRAECGVGDGRAWALDSRLEQCGRQDLSQRTSPQAPCSSMDPGALCLVGGRQLGWDAWELVPLRGSWRDAGDHAAPAADAMCGRSTLAICSGSQNSELLIPLVALICASFCPPPFPVPTTCPPARGLCCHCWLLVPLASAYCICFDLLGLAFSHPFSFYCTFLSVSSGWSSSAPFTQARAPAAY